MKRGEPIKQEPVGFHPSLREANEIIFDSVLMPSTATWRPIEQWWVIVALCDEKTDKLLGYGQVGVWLVSSSFAWGVSIGLLGLFWLIFAISAWQLNAAKLQSEWKNAHRTANNPLRLRGLNDLLKSEILNRLLWKLFRSINPLFISQDSLGYASLARLQILLFSSAVFVVLFYIFVNSNELSPMSETILYLLGITVAGGTFASYGGDWKGISAESRRLLLGQGILNTHHHKPRIVDVFESLGEIDVRKIQAALFTTLVIISIILKGTDPTGLGSFELPKEIVGLTIISQATYVVGKYLPADTRQRLEEDLKTLRACALDLRKEPSNIVVVNAFNQAKRAAASTLSETFLDRFNARSFDDILPEEIV